MQLADLQFDPAAHVYSVAGERWPSVTQILDPLLELDGIPKATLAAAAAFGTNVDRACHLFSVGQLDEQALDSHLVPYLAGWKQFLFDTGAVVVASCRKVMHPRLKYAGELDAVLAWKRKHFLVDRKATAEVPRTVGPQTAAYREAYSHEGKMIAPLRYCIHLRPDGTYRLVPLADPRDWSFFLSALNIWNWRNRNG